MMLPLFPHPPALAIALALCMLSCVIGASCLACALIVTARAARPTLSRGERLARRIAGAEREHRLVAAAVEGCVQRRLDDEAANGVCPAVGRKPSVIYVHRGLPSSGALRQQLALLAPERSSSSSSSSSKMSERARLVGGSSIRNAPDTPRSPLRMYGSTPETSLQPSIEPKLLTSSSKSVNAARADGFALPIDAATRITRSR